MLALASRGTIVNFNKAKVTRPYDKFDVKCWAKDDSPLPIASNMLNTKNNMAVNAALLPLLHSHTSFTKEGNTLNVPENVRIIAEYRKNTILDIGKQYFENDNNNYLKASKSKLNYEKSLKFHVL